MCMIQDYVRQHGGNPDDCNEKHELVKKATEMRDKAKEQVCPSLRLYPQHPLPDKQHILLMLTSSRMC